MTRSPKFAADSFSDTEAGINAVAASGNPLAFDIIDALQNSRLFSDPATKKIYIRQASGRTARRLERQCGQRAVRSQAGAHQQPAAPLDRGRARAA
jgi:urea transport system permease protein